MGCKKAVADDLLADIPNVVAVQSLSSQSQPKPKPKRLKKAQPKAMVTQIDTEDTLQISKLAEGEKTSSAAEAPSITIEDKPVRAGDSADDIEDGVVLSIALLLPKDLDRNAEVSEYENFTMMLHHSVKAIQHTYSFAIQAFDIKKELVNKAKEAANLLKSINKAEAKMKTLMDQAKAAKQAQEEADERVGAAEAIAKVHETEKKEADAKTTKAQVEVIAALATKDAEIKVADEKTCVEGVADVREDYKKQVKQACNKGFTLGWMAALKELAIPEDSPLKDGSRLVLPFPFTLSQSEDEAESEEEAEADKSEKAEEAGAKSPTMNEQVLDLTLDEDGEVSKGASSQRTTFEVPIVERGIDQSLREIDVELEAEKAAEEIVVFWGRETARY
ncbi:enolase-phosphatase E1-like [Camellia sinensis]|uniref:enolase-phosphatase E1-like n=1 Tax=Camellia sinensis TaxID=4442 RepID=UPI001035BC5C|nr:enolase-phosphatase E1-like [Camellia sinensis]